MKNPQLVGLLTAEVIPFMVGVIMNLDILHNMPWKDLIRWHQILVYIDTCGVTDSERPVVQRAAKRLPDAAPSVSGLGRELRGGIRT